MKKFTMAFLLTIGIGALHGCTTPEPRKENAPLQTGHTVKPPPGCIELRKRGGSC